MTESATSVPGSNVHRTQSDEPEDVRNLVGGSPQPMPLASLRVAIVHSFLIGQGGGEKVIDALARLFPRAEFFTLILSRDSLSSELRDRVIHSTFLDRIPNAARFYQHLSPLYDRAAENHRLEGFDLIISSGGAGAKTIVVPPGTPHIHYCHSPVRFLWDQNAVWRARLPALPRALFTLTTGPQRRRDYAAAQRVDAFIANSDYIGQRIQRYYKRESTTIYPPVEINRGPVPRTGGDYYLTVGRLVPGKRTELLVEACNALGRKLVVVGSGPEFDRLTQMAGPTVTIAGRVSDAALIDLYKGARAFLFASDEDFGIATAEAQSFGLPAIALGHGGSLEILDEGTEGTPSAVLFSSQSASSVADAIERFERREHEFDRASISRSAERFSQEAFASRIESFVVQTLSMRGSAGLASSSPAARTNRC